MSIPRILFHRDFIEYTGGHGKVWDYFQHALALGWDARVHLSKGSLRDGSNPWMACPERIEPLWQPAACDVLFLAGMDWNALADFRQPPRPVVNLLQHVRHAWPEHPLRTFLTAPARRICVSQAVTEAVLATGEVNGPVVTIAAALELPELPVQVQVEEDGPVVIAGLKAPALARALEAELHVAGQSVEVLDQLLPRVDYLRKVASASVLVALPHPAEGFYLPALEAMALGVPVVSADCLGSRQYARHAENCLLAPLQVPPLAAAVLQLRQQPAWAARLIAAGRRTAAGHSLAVERERFAQVLAGLHGE